MDNKAILKYVILTFLGWRLALLFITFLGLGAVPNIDFFKKELYFPDSGLLYWSRWANWDGLVYQQIAVEGYTPILTVFFPGYPLAIRAFMLMGLSSFWAGFIISQISTIVSMFFLFKLSLLEFGGKTAKRSILALLIFPTSFYLVTLYNESFFLALTISSFYFARTGKWLIASILGGIACATRLVGIAVVAALFAEFLLKPDYRFKLSFIFQTKIRRLLLLVILATILIGFTQNFFVINHYLPAAGFAASMSEILRFILLPLGLLAIGESYHEFCKTLDFKKIFTKNFLYLLASGIPILLYLFFLGVNFGSPFSFLQQEVHWGKILSYPWQGPLSNLGFLFSNLLSIGEYSSRVHLRFAVFIVLLVGLLTALNKLRPSYSLFYFLAFLIPLASGTLIDLPRYALVLFPLFILLGLIKNEFVQLTGAVISILILSQLTVLYFNSYFFM